MENKVIMALNDYNALKRKADAFDTAITVNAYSTWVEININPQVLKAAVDMVIKQAISEGTIPAERLKMRPTNQWYGSITVADLKPEPEEKPTVYELE